ncbi:hypothetical protein R3X25_02220 [Lutibacter sp. TH_r2]|uniref:hypothetical protein n=1 Tax=Lutibacter sp. TH_r2 TaxID=3082083 RepID=UPI0029555181|nr:hypothetical protein [Lutibacter sp. TH_r2]MDV7186084.1 hypothetical protein [Lutibacter sp. TH_r2]
MTAQRTDSIIYIEEYYTSPNFNRISIDLKKFGLRYYEKTTAGGEFNQTFEIKNNRLKLKTIEAVDLDLVEKGIKNYIPKKIFGVLPKVEINLMSDLKYENIDKEILFSGKLIIMNDFIDELYIHSGFHQTWKFKNVRELSFKDGILKDDKDQSERNLLIRERKVIEELYRLSLKGETNTKYLSYYENFIKKDSFSF